jgi:hypothetical protein
MRSASIVICVGVLAALAPTAASGDGLPLPVEDLGGTGVVTPDGNRRYVTVNAGGDTVLERVETNGGEVSDSIRLRGSYTIPAVGLDGSPGGLSADGSTLILIRPRLGFPRETTEFIRFDTEELRKPRAFSLEGDFSFDALSPDGRTMYLINYTSPRDPTEYDVRAYDLAAGDLEPGAIVDPDEAGDEMYGFALSRVTSPDGRWAYTLYWGREHPFIHALNTVDGTADCIDLEVDLGRDMYVVGLQPGAGGDYLVVTRRGKPAYVVDPVTHTAGEVPTGDLAAAVGRGGSEPPGSSATVPWIAVGAIVTGLVLAGLVGVLAVRRRPRPLAS